MATRPSSASLEVETVCCDPAEHRRRVELREPDLADHELSTWQTSWRATTTSGIAIGSSWTPASARSVGRLFAQTPEPVGPRAVRGSFVIAWQHST